MNKSKTKIIATIGPSTWKDEVLLEMINNGLSVARINASFADFKEIDRVSSQLRSLSHRLTIMLDTMGHKIRVTGFEKDKIVKNGDEIILVSLNVKTEAKNAIQVTYPTLEKDVTRGTRILIDDGNIELVVKDINEKKVITTVMNDGIIKPKKTVNIPGVHLKFDALSKKDAEDIKYSVENKLIDIISASFIRNASDAKLIRNAVGNNEIKIIAKIENQEGIDNFDEILAEVDGIMVARGDLGVEVPLERVPILQKQFIYKCRMAGKPVIVATQMLESMRENSRPTRAEVSDVANAIMDGTDAVMLSAETSTGKYPAEAVKAMSDICFETEKFMVPQIVDGKTESSSSTDAICKHIYAISTELKLAGVIIVSRDGKSVGTLARHRLKVPIWEVSNNPRIIRQNQLFSNVTGFYIQDLRNDRDDFIKQAIDVVYGNGYLELKDKVAIIGGSTVNDSTSDSLLEIVEVDKIVG